MMLYNHELVLFIDVKHNLDREKEGEIEDEKLHRRNKNMIMIVDICLIQKLGSMTWF